MKNLTYNKVCVAETLTQAIITAGYPCNPDAGARFYGVSVDEGVGTTTVHAFSDLTNDEESSINTIVQNQ